MATTATQERDPQIQQPAPAVVSAPPAASIRPETAVASPPPASSIRQQQPDAEAQMRNDRMDRHNEHDQATLRQRVQEEAETRAHEEGREITPEETALLDESVERTQQVADGMPDMVTENIGMGIFMTIIMEVFGMGQANGNSFEGMDIEGLIGQMFSSLIPGLGIAGAGMAGPSLSSDTQFTSSSSASASFRENFSRGIEQEATSASARGVRYNFGGRGNSSDSYSGIDCSGFVYTCLQEAGTNTGFNGNEFNTTSEDQIVRLKNKGAEILEGSSINGNTIDAGFVIGIDSGRTSFDRGRQYGIDHVVTTFRDSQTGELMVAESRSGKGVDINSFDSWLEKANRNGWDMYAADAASVAEQEVQLASRQSGPEAPTPS